ncbi:hypothetical protein [Bacillus solimangrovi]|uniref:Uncharacterized protein n=1 Tax=Bacillus solimangrovi TaxID=1305675 RepID=A0A1E5LJG8_9BACI|nr:hypothetical protein [Bacillus solimangrovi]OEH94242.1 hypothetical protein BFG57_09340 [Bacillus solimangrovi]
MKQIIKFELNKIFSQKGIYIAMLLLFSLFVLMLVNESRNISPRLETKAYEIKEELRILAQDWEGKLNEEKFNEASQTSDALFDYSSSTSDLTHKETAELFITESYIRNYNTKYKTIPERINELDVVLNKSNKNEVAYKNALQEKNMLNDLKLDTFQYNTGPKTTIDFVDSYSYFFTGIILLIGLSPLFVKEATTGMDQLIYSSTHGRKKGVIAKLLASFIFLSFVILTWVTFDLLLVSYMYGNSGWSSPVQLLQYSLVYSPYSLTALQYFLIQIGTHFLAGIAFISLILLVSSLSKNLLVPFVTCGAIFIAPIINIGSPFWEYVRKYSFSNFMKGPGLHEFNAVNVFGFSVLDPIFNVSLLILFSVALIIFLYKTIQRKQIS